MLANQSLYVIIEKILLKQTSLYQAISGGLHNVWTSHEVWSFLRASGFNNKSLPYSFKVYLTEALVHCIFGVGA